MLAYFSSMETSYEPSGFPIDDHGEDHATDCAEACEDLTCQVLECDRVALDRGPNFGVLCQDCFEAAREVWADYQAFKRTGVRPSYVREEARS